VPQQQLCSGSLAIAEPEGEALRDVPSTRMRRVPPLSRNPLSPTSWRLTACLQGSAMMSSHRRQWRCQTRHDLGPPRLHWWEIVLGQTFGCLKSFGWTANGERMIWQ
jgi:hypothetical protein